MSQPAPVLITGTAQGGQLMTTTDVDWPADVNLSNMASKVTLVHRRDKFKAEPILVDKLKQRVADGKVDLKGHRTLDEILGDASGVTGIRLKSTLTGETENIDLQAASSRSATNRTPTSSRVNWR
jgi:thioredoxin reductase